MTNYSKTSRRRTRGRGRGRPRTLRGGQQSPHPSYMWMMGGRKRTLRGGQSPPSANHHMPLGGGRRRTRTHRGGQGGQVTGTTGTGDAWIGMGLGGENALTVAGRIQE